MRAVPARAIVLLALSLAGEFQRGRSWRAAGAKSYDERRAQNQRAGGASYERATKSEKKDERHLFEVTEVGRRVGIGKF